MRSDSENGDEADRVARCEEHGRVGIELDRKLDGLTGKNPETTARFVLWRDGKFGSRTVKLQRPHRAIGEDYAVPTNIPTRVAFRDNLIRGWRERHEPETQLTIFTCGNFCWGVCPGR